MRHGLLDAAPTSAQSRGLNKKRPILRRNIPLPLAVALCLACVLVGMMAQRLMTSPNLLGGSAPDRREALGVEPAHGRPALIEGSDSSNAESMKLNFVSWTAKNLVSHPDTRIVHIEHFLTDEECDHIIKAAKDSMQRSEVVDIGSTEGKIDQIRTSTGTFLAPAYDAVVAEIEHRIAELTMLPVENQEAMQVLHYGIGEKYGAHMDTFFDPRLTTPAVGGERIATLLMFLSTPEFGGETVFADMPGTNEGPEWSECARKGLAVHPKKGNAVLFWSLFPNGTIDMMASHTACPVVKGEKWSAPKWLRTNNFQREHRSAPIVEPCVDMHAGCKDWAAKGECEANAAFMVGAKGAIGQCRVSCNACPYPKLLGTTGNGAPKPVKDSFLTETIARRTGVGKKADEEDQRRRRI